MNEIDASSGSIFWTASAATSCFPQPTQKIKIKITLHIYILLSGLNEFVL